MQKFSIKKGRVERLELRVGGEKRILPRLVIIAGSSQAQVDRKIASFWKADRPEEFLDYRTTFIVPYFGKPKEPTRQPAPAKPTIDEDLTGKTDSEIEEMLTGLRRKAAEVRK